MYLDAGNYLNNVRFNSPVIRFELWMLYQSRGITLRIIGL